MQNEALIQTLVRECGCTRKRAINLLKQHNNDIEKAKEHHRLVSFYTQGSQDEIPSQDEPPTPPAHASAGLGQDDLSFRSPGTPSTPPLSRRESFDMGFKSDARGSTPQFKESSQSLEWDFTLPRLPPLEILTEDDFSPDSLASAIQHGASVRRLREYLTNYDSALLKQDINANVMGFPLIFYAVETNNENMVRLLIDFGASASAVNETSQIPVLAFALIGGDTLQLDTTNMVSVLLSKGASPNAIPMEVFTPYLVDIEKRRGEEGKRPVEEPAAAAEAAWCSGAIRERLVKSVNLTQRYFLEKSAKLKRPSTKRCQVARIKNCEGLLGIPYFLVGQSVATELLTQRLLTHLLMPTKQPLVLCFAGPSGHGKTELARQLGHLLTLDLEVVDCTTFTHEMELFGPRRPYHGYEKGSAVNNFLVQHAGRKCIVFLDEFEKTTKEIHQTLLLPWDNGEYQDRRTGDKIDCSNTIWIMATNALDETILDFYENNDAIAGEDVDERAPVTGRISDFIPLLPFSNGEQAVITHKCLLELVHDLRPAIDLTKGHERLIGDIRLQIRKDGTVCSILAKKHYHSRLGARSLKAGAETVKRIVLDAYLDDNEQIEEKQNPRDAVIDVDGKDIVGKILPLAKKTNAKAKS